MPYPPDEIAVRCHHRLVFIHPFANGNGRHARLTAELLARKLGRPIFPWGRGTAAPAAVRANYLAAIRTADQQDYTPLFALARAGSLWAPPLLSAQKIWASRQRQSGQEP